MWTQHFRKIFVKVSLKMKASGDQENISKGKSPGFTEDNQGVFWYKGRICVLDVKEIKDIILREAHNSTYSIHLGGNKMYQNLKVTYLWYE
jgi:hypothetical protein